MALGAFCLPPQKNSTRSSSRKQPLRAMLTPPMTEKFFGALESRIFLQISSPLWPAVSVRTACSMSPYAVPSISLVGRWQ
ncbi:hypothetical protein HNY73_021498 [Argiope bruennichi]|uniref:Uncharacterized protein n=1 Tax=Argiope bruennichi TaxID=94029 RepID=A0A8T0DXP9_ARGBR|nr:hypothetical protein HNY73_021498 [Argiope bruennichi]